MVLHGTMPPKYTRDGIYIDSSNIELKEYRIGGNFIDGVVCGLFAKAVFWIYGADFGLATISDAIYIPSNSIGGDEFLGYGNQFWGGVATCGINFLLNSGLYWAVFYGPATLIYS